MNLKTSYYKNCLLSIHRGFAFGEPSNAKPLYLLAIIKGIDEGVLLGNKLQYGEILETFYRELCSYYEPNKKAAPFYKPFFHSARENYYNIKWKAGEIPKHKWHTPSPKFLRESVDYAFLNEDFWELLQDIAIRNNFRDLIVNHYLKTRNKEL